MAGVRTGRPLPVDAEIEHRGSAGDANGAGAGMGSNSNPNSRPASGSTTPNMDGDRDGVRNMNSGGSRGIHGISARRRNHKNRQSKPKGHGEVDEEELVDDLRSWRVEEGVYG